MKVFIVVILFIALAAADDKFGESISGFLRITGGTKAKPKLVPSFVGLQVFYDHGTKTCGGFLGPTANQIVTAANCVFE